ncbi:alpha/beta hydrolase [Levilactobacillus spicheri]|uniref:Membrane protein n=1 Tax=Levilactobacillus spicheri TaxID=216463 RepID=A0A0F3RR87_9LACO|nr:alpha/beta hydrolase [Levilactobacillus spicheri]KJW12548.1 membrane protein [Levilactobacillus spicheri]
MENDTRIFEVYPNIEVKKARFKNRFGIELAGDVYLPENYATKKSPAIVVSGPFGAVKEQSSGLYAQEMATWGFVAIAFDPSYTGESAGTPRNVASPDINTEDFSAAVDYLGLQSYVDRERIGAMAICGLSGMAITATATDTRIKAVATASMYDMSRSISRGYRDSYTPEERHQIKDYISQQRWIDAANGEPAIGPHEVAFDENGQIMKTKGLPEELPENPNPVLAAFYDYYKTPRGYHPHSINSTGAWTATTPMSFFNFPLMTNVKEISPRPLMLIAGEKAHSLYYSEDVYQEANDPKELVVVPGANHVDLYDRKDLIPFDKLEAFFKKALS